MTSLMESTSLYSILIVGSHMNSSHSNPLRIGPVIACCENLTNDGVGASVTLVGNAHMHSSTRIHPALKEMRQLPHSPVQNSHDCHAWYHLEHHVGASKIYIGVSFGIAFLETPRGHHNETCVEILRLLRWLRDPPFAYNS
jgi:hypothetical protein